MIGRVMLLLMVMIVTFVAVNWRLVITETVLAFALTVRSLLLMRLWATKAG